MGNFLLQRGLLIYILAPRSCDLYMIFLQYLRALFVCIYLAVSTDHMVVTYATDGHRVAGYILALACRGPTRLKGLSLRINIIRILFNCLFLEWMRCGE